MRVALVSEAPISGAVSRGLGFSARNAALVQALDGHELTIVFLEQDPSAFSASVTEMQALARVEEVEIPTMPRRRLERIAQVARLSAGDRLRTRWERRLVGLLEQARPDAVIALAPVCRYAFRALPREFATVTVVEEDQSEHSDVRSTPWGRALVRAERAVEYRPLRRSACVGVIADSEVDWAEQTFPGVPVVVVPHSVDLAYWAATTDTAVELAPGSVLVVGRMVDERNARGLRRVIDALQGTAGADAPSLVVASSSGLHPILEEVADSFHFLGAVEDLRPYYRAATATLVPSFVVSGAKTTILQGWATCCPVVTTAPSARAMGAESREALAVGASANEVADELRRVVGDERRRAGLAAAGERAVHDRYSVDAVRAAIERALRLATGTPSR